MKRKLSVRFDRWPWQPTTGHWSWGNDTRTKWGWKKPPGMGRFGGGWDYKLGFAWSSSGGTFTLALYLLFGTVTITNYAREPKA